VESLGADVNRRTCGGETALHKAVLGNRSAAAAELLRLGADPNARTGMHRGCAAYAA
jgi:ankyrin repeat protein